MLNNQITNIKLKFLVMEIMIIKQYYLSIITKTVFVMGRKLNQKMEKKERGVH